MFGNELIRYRGDSREPSASDAGDFLKAQSDWTVLGKDFREKVGQLLFSFVGKFDFLGYSSCQRTWSW